MAVNTPVLSYAKPLDAGLDLTMNGWLLEDGETESWRYFEDVTIAPGDSVQIRTGIKVQIPLGVYGRVSVRSGLGIKQGLVCHDGVIDSGYEGEIFTRLYNLGYSPATIRAGSRIVQMVLAPYIRAEIVQVSSITAIGRGERAEAGLGSTGER